MMIINKAKMRMNIIAELNTAVDGDATIFVMMTTMTTMMMTKPDHCRTLQSC